MAASAERPGLLAQALGLGAGGVFGGRAGLLVGVGDRAGGGDQAGRAVRANAGASDATSPPCAPMPGSRNGVCGISSRRRARCSGWVAPVTAPTSSRTARTGAAPAPAGPEPVPLRRRRGPRTGALGDRSGRRVLPRGLLTEPATIVRAVPTGARRSPAARPESAAPGLDVRTSTNTPAPARACGGDQRLQRVASEQRVGGERVGLQARDGPERGRRAADQRLRVGGRGDRDVAALAVGEHEQAVRARVQRTRARARASRARRGARSTRAGA